MRNCLEPTKRRPVPALPERRWTKRLPASGPDALLQFPKTKCGQEKAAPSHDGWARSPGRFASRGQLNVVLVFHLGGVDFLNADLESEQLPFQIGFTAPFTGRGHGCSLSRRMADGRWRENRQRKVRTPQGSMPCRTRGRRRRKPGATESVTENKPPAGSRETGWQG